MAKSDDEAHTISLQDQRAFGAGLKRKRVQFIPASTTSTLSTSVSRDGHSIAERYLAIVRSSGLQNNTASSCVAPSEYQSPSPVCDLCDCPIEGSNAVPHEASLAHQVCLQHSHPPSAIDRTRKGLAYLEAYDWNPDERTGLGAAGEGILFPLKIQEKRDTAGLGLQSKVSKKGEKEIKRSRQKLDARKARKLEAEGKNKLQKLHDQFYQDEDIMKYLRDLG